MDLTGGLNLDLTVGREETASLSEEEKEKRLLLKTLEEAEGNRARTARMLGISRTSLYEKLKNTGLYERASILPKGGSEIRYSL